MSTLRTLRRQIRSISNIKKITDAMERVAASRLKKAQRKAEMARPYLTGLKRVMEGLVEGNVRNPLFQERKVKQKVALIVVTSDRGLTGPYNTNVFLAANDFLKSRKKEDVELFLFGRKAIDLYSRKGFTIGEQFRDWGEKLTFPDIQNFSERLIRQFLEGRFDEVFVVYTHYITVMTREVIVDAFLPLTTKKSRGSFSQGRIFEPKKEEILEELMPRFFAAELQQYLNESYASELASRIFAMRSASSNSEELMETLTLRLNKLRQSQITREMIEITMGAQWG